MKTFTFRRILSQAALVIGVVLFSAGLQTYAATFAQPTSSAPNGDAVAPLDTGSNQNTKAGSLVVNSDGSILAGLTVNRNLVVMNGDIETPTLCLNGDCKSTWPTGGTGTITGVTAGTGLTGGGTSGNVTLNVKNSPAIYQCPYVFGIYPDNGGGAGHGAMCPSSCTGDISTNSSCSYVTYLTSADSCSGGPTVVGCTFVGYIVQP